MQSLSSSSFCPPCVTHATSGAKPFIKSDSFFIKFSGINRGIDIFLCPVSLNILSSSFCIFSQIA